MREMKDSGVEWIGEIPKDWRIAKFKFFFSIIGGCGFKEEYQGASQGDYPFLKASDINGSERTVSSAKNYVNHDLVQQERYNVVPSCSIIIAKIGEALKKNHRKINTCDCIIDNNCEAFTLISSADNDISYLYYVLSHIDMVWFDNGGTVPSVNNEKLRDFFLPYPSKATQHRIADYLDAKCAQIDRAIARQQEVIEKLKEYKLLRINEVLADVVENACHLGFVGNFKNGLNFNNTTVGIVTKFLGVGDFKNNFAINKIDMLSDVITAEPIPHEYLLENNDIVFVRSNGSKELVGRSLMVQDIEVPVSFSGFCIRFRNQRQEILNPNYLLYFFRSPDFRKQLEILSNGSNINNINQVMLSKVEIRFPSLDAQERIVEFLDIFTVKIEEAILLKDQIIDKLTEYKKSLIYEVVTGKREV